LSSISLPSQPVRPRHMNDMRDVVRNEPAISVGNQPGRGGFTTA
jgi:hypothetical protein